MRVNPEAIRYRYQYARALEIDDPKKALKIHEHLIHDGYLPSYDNAGSILIGTYKKMPEAIKYFNEGVRRGDPDSMVSLASLIDQQLCVQKQPSRGQVRASYKGSRARSSREKFQELQQQREFQQQQQQLILQLFAHFMQGIAH
jgi:hypothetical protein